MRLITWNIARRRARLVEQATALAEREPTFVALQEVTRQTLPIWRHAFALMGLGHVRSSLDEEPAQPPGDRRRATGVIVGSRMPLAIAPHCVSVPWPETALWVVARSSSRDVEILCVHVPNAANGQIKPQSLRAIRAGLAGAGDGARIVCGDMNTPRRELPTGEVMSFARDRYGRLRPDRGTEWDAAELGVVPGLRDLGYRDVFRAIHGYARREPSWTWQQIAGHRGGWRLDHVFASPSVEPIAARYHHAWRDSGLSDHSALEADFQPSTIG